MFSPQINTFKMTEKVGKVSHGVAFRVTLFKNLHFSTGKQEKTLK